MKTLPHERAEASPARTLPTPTTLGAPEALAQKAGAAVLGEGGGQCPQAGSRPEAGQAVPLLY